MFVGCFGICTLEREREKIYSTSRKSFNATQRCACKTLFSLKDFQDVLYIHVHTCKLYMYTCFNDGLEKEGRKKQAIKVKQTTRQSNTAHPRQLRK